MHYLLSVLAILIGEFLLVVVSVPQAIYPSAASAPLDATLAAACRVVLGARMTPRDSAFIAV
jgi:hypothetical protein